MATRPTDRSASPSCRTARRAPAARGSFSARSLPILILIGIGSLLFSALPGRSADDEEEPATAANGVRPYGRYFLRQFGTRNRTLDRELARAEREVAAGRFREAVQSLQAVLEQPQDGFVFDEHEGRLFSGRFTAARMLAGLPPEGQRVADQYAAAAADQLLRDAEASRRWWMYGDVIRRYPLSAAAFTASATLADRWTDRGNLRTAADYWKTLLRQPVHRRRFDQATLQKALIIGGKAGDSDLTALARAELAARFPEDPLAGGNEPHRKEAISPPRRGSDREWPVLMGDSPRTRASWATPPFLDPMWTSVFQAEGSDELFKDIVEWDGQQSARAQPRAVANAAIAVGNHVIVRDFDGIRALDLQSGRPVWNFRGTATYLRPSPVAAPAPRTGTPLATTRLGAGRVTPADVFTESSVLGSLSSDGQRVFAIDALELSLPRGMARPGGPNTQASKGSDLRAVNYLVAIPLEEGASTKSPAERKPVWKVGGLLRGDGKPEAPLAGHFFLGAPLPSDGRLFALSESDSQLSLTMLDAADGRILWSQGLGYVERSIENDSFRAVQGCLPACDEETVVCPTQAGVLAAVAADTGSLKWLYHCGDDPTDGRGTSFMTTGRASHGHEGFPAVPLISRGQVFYLPHLSRDVHCVDLATGVSRWTAPRGDGQYLGAVTDDLLIVVGSRTCRALSLEDGRERWSVRVGMPSGMGLRVQSHYLLPLEDGRILALDLATGKESGISVPRLSPGWSDGNRSDDLSPVSHPPGNLIPAGDFLVTAGTFGLVAYRQSGRVLEQTLAELRQNPGDQGLQLREAELVVQAGDRRKAAPQLRRLLAASLAAQHKERAERLLREILYLDLSAATTKAEAEPILRELDVLSSTSDDRGRFLVRRVDWQLKSGDIDGVLSSVHELSELDSAHPIAFAANSLHLVSAGGWAPAILERLRERAGVEGQNRVAAEARNAAAAALESGEEKRLERFLSVYGRWPEANNVRLKLARQLMDEGKFQHAELLLLQALQSEDFATRAEATGALASAWDRLGLPHEAARLIVEFERRASRPGLSETETATRKRLAQEWIAALPETSLTRPAIEQLGPVGSPVRRVRISEDRLAAGDSRLDDAFAVYRRKFPMPPENSFHLLDKGAGDRNASGDSRAAVVDRHTGTITGYIGLPVRNSYPTYLNLVRWNHAGHFFTMGAEGEALGVSLVDFDGEQPLWRTPLPHTAARDMVRAGPAGSSFCTFQSRKSLYVLDPATGQLVWERSDLEPTSGLMADPNTGLFGDSECLVVFDGDATDRGNYTVYRTSTGEELRHGHLDIDTSQTRRAVGRRLIFVSPGNTERRLRLWDPLENRFLIDEPVDDRPQAPLVCDDELAVIQPSGRLLIRDIETQQIRLDVKLRPDDLVNLTNVRIFRDADTYFVNLQREMRTPFPQSYSQPVDNAFVPTTPLGGDLYAIDRQTGRIRWKQFFSNRSVIDLPGHRLPFLITVSRLRDRSNGTRQSLLVEVIDKETGATLGSKGDILPDRIVVFDYDPSKAQVELFGLETVVRIRFGRDVQRPSSGQWNYD